MEPTLQPSARQTNEPTAAAAACDLSQVQCPAIPVTPANFEQTFGADGAAVLRDLNAESVTLAKGQITIKLAAEKAVPMGDNTLKLEKEFSFAVRRDGQTVTLSNFKGAELDVKVDLPIGSMTVEATPKVLTIQPHADGGASFKGVATAVGTEQSKESELSPQEFAKLNKAFLALTQRV